jgi:hypothetical protein
MAHRDGSATQIYNWTVSVSVIAALPEAERDKIGAQVRAVIAQAGPLAIERSPAGEPIFIVPMHTDLYWCKKL